jgi:hypothetical protein
MDTLEVDFQAKVEEKRVSIMKYQDEYRKLAAQMQQAMQQQQQQ